MEQQIDNIKSLNWILTMCFTYEFKIWNMLNILNEFPVIFVLSPMLRSPAMKRQKSATAGNTREAEAARNRKHTTERQRGGTTKTTESREHTRTATPKEQPRKPDQGNTTQTDAAPTTQDRTNPKTPGNQPFQAMISSCFQDINRLFWIKCHIVWNLNTIWKTNY